VCSVRASACHHVPVFGTTRGRRGGPRVSAT
jgi:hypothetical protein